MPSRKALRPRVMLDGVVLPAAELMACERSTGGGRLDHAVVRINKSIEGVYSERIQEYDLGEQYVGSFIEVVLDTPGGSRVVHWGEIEQEELTISDQGEMIHLVSRINPGKHFGKGIWGQKQYDARGGGYVQCAQEIIFNPVVDGAVRGNMRKAGSTSGDDGVDYPTFVDPEAFRTPEALAYQDLPGAFAAGAIGIGGAIPISIGHWTLADAVYYCCKFAGSGAQIRSPEYNDLVSVLNADPLGGKTQLQDHWLPGGLFLPDALDNLLTPYGFSWYIDYETEGSRSIKIVKLGDGQKKTVTLARIGDHFNKQTTELARLDLTYSDSSRVSNVLVIGARKQVEAAFELVPAWNDDRDNWPIDYPERLCRDCPEFHDNADYQRVWRDWVLNEDGGYVDTRPKAAKPPEIDFLTLTNGGVKPITAGGLVKRRRFLPTLTLGVDGKPIGQIDGCVVQYFDETREDGPWIDIQASNDPDCACTILINECGISFTGSVPPSELVWKYRETGDVPRIRVIATIELDSAIESSAGGGGSGSGADVTLWAPDRFQHRRLHRFVSRPQIDSSPYAEKVDSGELKSAEIDGQKAADGFAEQLAAAWDHAEILGTLRLEGLDTLAEYKPGDVITRVDGRSIRLDTRPGSYGGERSNPQIAGVTFQNDGGQYTTITLTTFRLADAQIAAAKRQADAVHRRRQRR
jgi:hypothetical protein